MCLKKLLLVARGFKTIGEKPAKALVEPSFDCLKEVGYHHLKGVCCFESPL